VELPETGFLAGGAVANTIFSMEWGGDYPINDLDIFRIESTDWLVSMIMPHRSTRGDPFGSCKGIIAINNYGRSYTVSKTEVKGILNFINVQLEADHQKMEKLPESSWRDFDLKTAVRQESTSKAPELIYSLSFEAF